MFKETHMGTPRFTAIRLFDPLQHMAASLGRWFRGRSHLSEMRVPAPPNATLRPAAVRAALPACHRARPARRLRVVRVLESSQAAANAGRMVISGRMADVCAELERLAALEAAAG
jgi:hypothetical protein